MFKGLKEYRLLFIGLLLPLLLAIFFWVFPLLPSILTTAPKYDLLYLTLPYPHEGILTAISDGKLNMAVTPEVVNNSLPMPHLFVFDSKTQSTDEILLDKPELPKGTTKANKITELLIPELQAITVDPDMKAPDGYTAVLNPPTYNGIFTLFLSDINKKILVIEKDSRIITVVDEGNNPYNDKSIIFLGWIIK